MTLVKNLALSRQLLLHEKYEQLPWLEITLTPREFYIVVPPVVLVLHACLLFSVLKVLQSAGNRAPWRSQLLALSEVVLPVLGVLLLVWMQVTFLPYHSVRITWWIRLMVLVDPGVVCCFCRRVAVGGVRRKYYLRIAVALTSGGAGAFCLMFAVIPGECIEIRALGRLADSLFYRSLHLPGEVLVSEGGSEKLDLRGRDLRLAILTAATLKGADLQGAQLQGSDLKSADLSGAELTKADLRGANAKNARLDGADLRYAQLQGADLSHTHLQNANLWRARLQGATLVWAELQCARFREAHLQGAKLNKALVRNANFRRAKLGLSDWRGLEIETRPSVDCGPAGDGPPSFSPDASETRAVYDKGGPFPEWLKLMKEESYEREVAEFLTSLACGEQHEDEHIANGIARRAMNYDPFLRQPLLDARCLDSDTRALLGALVRSEVPR